MILILLNLTHARKRKLAKRNSK